MEPEAKLEMVFLRHKIQPAFSLRSTIGVEWIDLAFRDAPFGFCLEGIFHLL
jgi:hypothetical protein